MLKVLFAASESVPFIKTGGLADVAYSLPKELRKAGVDVRVVLPFYQDIRDDLKNNMILIREFNVSVGWRNQYCGIKYMEYDGIPFYFIDNEYYFKRNGIYGFYDDGERFAYFNHAVLKMIQEIDFIPQIIHCNDWHTGMISLLLHAHYHMNPQYAGIRTVFTIHNLKFQGVFPSDILGDLLSLSDDYNHTDALEFYGGISFMKGGITYSDKITTVSGSYALEIQNEFFGEKLDGLLRKRNNDLCGILNGIDYDSYNPETDPYIFQTYNKDSIHNKLVNKSKLQELLNLPRREDVPLIAMVSRIDAMKGFDLLFRVMEELMGMDLQIVILGTGDHTFESKLREFAYRYPDKLSVQIMFSTELAQKIYAGSDMLLMPSLFEPCGLSQLIALRYGTIPIVREIGGLKDTVFSYNEYYEIGNGFTFMNYNAHDMLYTIERAIRFYYDKRIWYKLICHAMDSQNNWYHSAEQYKFLYENLCKENG